jgi:hypothetical protein
MVPAWLLVVFALSAAETAPRVVQAPDAPVRIDRVKLLNVVAGEPAVLFYAATNLTDDDLEQFTVITFIFDAQGTLKARQTAPGRRTLEKRSTKYSTMVLDGWPVTATDQIVLGVDKAQRTESDKWWSAELEAAAREAVKKSQPSGAAGTSRAPAER